MFRRHRFFPGSNKAMPKSVLIAFSRRHTPPPPAPEAFQSLGLLLLPLQVAVLLWDYCCWHGTKIEAAKCNKTRNTVCWLESLSGIMAAGCPNKMLLLEHKQMMGCIRSSRLWVFLFLGRFCWAKDFKQIFEFSSEKTEKSIFIFDCTLKVLSRILIQPQVLLPRLIKLQIWLIFWGIDDFLYLIKVSSRNSTYLHKNHVFKMTYLKIKEKNKKYYLHRVVSNQFCMVLDERLFKDLKLWFSTC